MNYITPTVPCYCMDENNQIFIKRDDLLPFSFGGNKVRIAEEFFADMQKKGKNCMVGYGSVKSNLCRVMANMCSMRGIECHIISPDSDELTSNNRCLVNMCGAVVHSCTRGTVSKTVKDVVSQISRGGGGNPYYIYGNEFGRGNEAVPVRAYAKAYAEIDEEYDYIFFPTGTGMTQAGLIAGKRERARKEKIIGISVARGKEQQTDTVQKYLTAYYASQGMPVDVQDEITVIDDYIGEGYGSYDGEIAATIEKMYVGCGIPLDMTYTGKAFYGMLSYIKKEGIAGKKILFIHTGGTPLFFDDIGNIRRHNY